ncbi:hypothetical protein EVAR_57945_1 [Eumeta japonica]|uniref:Uncharacterized protein n=1 Tax=Eumeta variegata TaxID=151549 RepID=A0A4C1ZR74_EUMVA|nr:hypothetical protein EVAR_57945_1 [Eumeta japonica]
MHDNVRRRHLDACSGAIPAKSLIRFVHYKARNFAAVKSVTEASQRLKIGTRRKRRKDIGERNIRALHHSQPIQSGKVLCVVL